MLLDPYFYISILKSTNCTNPYSPPISVFLIWLWHRRHTSTIFCWTPTHSHAYHAHTHTHTHTYTHIHTHTHALTNSHHMPACAAACLNRHQFSMSQNHKEEKVIVFNYESYTCIIHGHFLLCFCLNLEKGQEEGSCWVTEVGLFFSLCEIMLGTAPDVSTYWWQALLKPLNVDCRWLLMQCSHSEASASVFAAQGHQTRLRSRRVHAGVSEGCGGMSIKCLGAHEHGGWHGLGWQVTQWADSAASNVLASTHYREYFL